MATSVLRHTDDDGVLSIFISGTEILFVCEKRHWWTVEASSSGLAGIAAAKRLKQGVLTESPRRSDKTIKELHEKFGPVIFDAMEIK